MPTSVVNIRMDEDLLKYLKERADKEHRTLSNMIISILLTEKEKGHGRLIDADEFISDIKKHYFDNETVIRCVEIALDNAPIIMEADKAESE